MQCDHHLNFDLRKRIWYALRKQGVIMKHQQTQKITAHIPVTLLKEAQAATGKGITETLKIALSQLAHASAYEALRKMRGKVTFSIDLEDLRKDR